MNDKIMEQVNEMTTTLELTVRDWNVLLNVLNAPQQVQTVVLARFIDTIQSQIGPQIEKAKATLASIANADGVPKDLEERN